MSVKTIDAFEVLDSIEELEDRIAPGQSGSDFLD